MMNQEQIQLQAEVDMLIDGVPLEELTLSQLFEESDRVGDKYLSPEEIQAREAQLQAARERISDIELLRDLLDEDPLTISDADFYAKLGVTDPDEVVKQVERVDAWYKEWSAELASDLGIE